MMIATDVNTQTPPPRPEDLRWQAVVNRDRRQDGQFVLAVRTTGIYCRPSCPARRPRRENVVFFDAPAGARSAGFRACLRCHPDDATDPRPAWVSRVCRHIEEGVAEGVRPTLERLSQVAGVGPHHLQRTFKALVGLSPRQYAEAVRRDRFRRELKGGRPVADAAYEAGYGSSARAYEGAALGMTPGAYRRGGRGLQLGYSLVDTSLGRLLVAATDAGVSMVALGDDDGQLVASLHDEFPEARLERDDEGFRPWVTQVLSRIEDPTAAVDLPLDLKATAFQRRVWEELRAIPSGETRSYSEVARALGRPRAARAVARACATNPAAIVIPCHRVVGADGRTGGYRWGTQRKRVLLLREAASGRR
jgi:AraC family transcriptional regulator, regulatory protein of adaptative response / methylated-DNA-[protein]-cysteine methyltransferase